MKTLVLVAAIVAAPAFAQNPALDAICATAQNPATPLTERIEAGAVCKEIRDIGTCKAANGQLLQCLDAHQRKRERGDFKREWMQELQLMMMVEKEGKK